MAYAFSLARSLSRPFSSFRFGSLFFAPSLFSLYHFPLPIYLPFKKERNTKLNTSFTTQRRDGRNSVKGGVFISIFICFFLLVCLDRWLLSLTRLRYLERNSIQFEEGKERNRGRGRRAHRTSFALLVTLPFCHIYSRLLIPFPSSLSLFFLSLPEKSLVSLNLTQHFTNRNFPAFSPIATVPYINTIH